MSHKLAYFAVHKLYCFLSNKLACFVLHKLAHFVSNKLAYFVSLKLISDYDWLWLSKIKLWLLKLYWVQAQNTKNQTVIWPKIKKNYPKNIASVICLMLHGGLCLPYTRGDPSGIACTVGGIQVLGSAWVLVASWGCQNGVTRYWCCSKNTNLAHWIPCVTRHWCYSTMQIWHTGFLA